MTTVDPTIAAFDAYAPPDQVQGNSAWVPPAPITVTAEVLEFTRGVQEKLGDKTDVPFVQFRYKIVDGEHKGRVVFGSRLYSENTPPRDEKIAEARKRALGQMKANCEVVLATSIPAGMGWPDVFNATADRVQEAVEAQAPLLASVKLTPSKPKGKSGFIQVYDDIKRLLPS